MIYKGGVKKFIFLLALIPSFVFAITNGFTWPISVDATISLKLGESWKDRSGKWYLGHFGEDIVVDPGTQVFSAAEGEVVTVKRWPICSIFEIVDGKRKLVEGSHGWAGVVVIKHGVENDKYFDTDGTTISDAEQNPQVIYTQYGHLDNINVEVGDYVKKGDKLAEVGDVCDWTPHLHFEIKDTAAITDDRKNSAGAGFGYSGIDGHAPHRYKPSEFIEKNKSVAVVEVPESTTQNNTQTVQSENQSSRLALLWRRLSTFVVHLIQRTNNLFADNEQPPATINDVPVITTTTPAVPAPIESATIYDSQFIPNPISISFVHGATQVEVVVKAKNIGTAIWNRQVVSLNVVGGKSANSMWYHPTWITQLRPANLAENTVAQNEVGAFKFNLSIPAVERTFKLQLVRNDNGVYKQIGAGFVTINLKEIIPPPVVNVPIVNIPFLNNPLITPPPIAPVILPPAPPAPILSPTPSTTVTPTPTSTTYYYGGGGGGGSGGGSPTVIPEPEVTPTSTPTTTEDIVTTTEDIVTTTEDIVTTTDPLPALADLVITAPVSSTEVWYVNTPTVTILGTSDDQTDFVIVKRDDMEIASTTPVDGLWQIDGVLLNDGTQELVLYGAGSGDRMTSTTTLTVVLDTVAPEIDIRLQSVSDEGLVTVELVPYDATQITQYEVMFYKDISFYDTACEVELFSYEASLFESVWNDEGVLEQNLIGTYTAQGCPLNTIYTTETFPTFLYGGFYPLVVRVKGTDQAGNISDWWYSEIPIYEDMSDVEVQF